MGRRSKATSALSASPITRSKSSATSSTWTCRRSARTVEQGKSLGSVESVKAVSDIYSPVSGEVIEVERRARGRAREAERGSARRGLAGQGPAVGDPDEVKSFMTAADYQTYIGAEK